MKSFDTRFLILLAALFSALAALFSCDGGMNLTRIDLADIVPATLSFNSPGAEGFGVKRAGLSVPGSVMLIVSPGCCGRNTSSISTLKGYENRFFYLTMDETDLVTGRHLRRIPKAVCELAESLEKKPSVIMICITCVDALLGTDMERVCRKAEKMLDGIRVRPCYMYALTREGRKPPMVHVRQSIYSLLEPMKKKADSVNIMGYFAPVDEKSELRDLLRQIGVRKIREVSSCPDFEEFQKMAEAKQKLRDLANREGDYADLPDNLYYIIYHTKAGKRVDAETGQIVNDIKKTIIPEGAEVFDTPVADETLIVYGLNHGNTDDIGQALKISYDKELTDVTDDDTGTEWTKETWLKASSDGTLKIKDDFINGLYINTPSTHAIWPIWQTFVDKSNGKLNNSWLGY